MSDKHYSFTIAIKALRAGAMVARQGWMKDGIFLFQQSKVTISKDRIDELINFSDQVKTMLRSLNQDVKFNPNISMMDSDGCIQSGWAAFDEDMDANDWVIL